MLKTITTIVATLAVAGIASADDAVQWTEAEGGNGHWYQAVNTGGPTTWNQSRLDAVARGGDLTSMETDAELAWVFDTIASDPDLWYWTGEYSGPYLGGFQDTTAPDYSEPAGGWYWLTGTPLQTNYWGPGEPNSPNQDHLHFWSPEQSVTMTFDNVEANDSNGGKSFIIEWSEDCNGDSIVDYGQILDGSLSDENGNGVPDCCDDTSCLPATQWKVEDGGNGNWYKAVVCTDLCLWQDARDTALQLGGDLVSLNTQLENEFVFSLIEDQPSLWFEFNGVYPGPYVGGFQDLSSPDYSEPDGAWMWVDGTLLEDGYVGWAANEPNNDCSGLQDQSYLAYMGIGAPEMTWNDIADECHNGMPGYVIEFSADCNGDGIVDYGQILDGSLADEDGNGIPDICELGDFGACCLAGTCVMTTATYCFEALGAYGGKGITCEEANCPTSCPGDIDGDGQVGIVDILVVIDRWGLCP